jgi:aminotransferase EvaB
LGEIDDALRRVAHSGRYLLGAECEAFEREFADWTGSAHCVGVASGTDALELALRAIEIGSTDEVVTQASTCVPTVSAIGRVGAQPVLCDVDPTTGLMDPDSLADVIGPATKAIIPVHLYGQCCDMDAIRAVADQHRVPVVEDCAQAHGATFPGGRAGTLGTLAAFSFYPTKNLGALGDGGAVVTDDAGLAGRIRALRQYCASNCPILMLPSRVGATSPRPIGQL